MRENTNLAYLYGMISIWNQSLLDGQSYLERYWASEVFLVVFDCMLFSSICTSPSMKDQPIVHKEHVSAQTSSWLLRDQYSVTQISCQIIHLSIWKQSLLDPLSYLERDWHSLSSLSAIDCGSISQYFTTSLMKDQRSVQTYSWTLLDHDSVAQIPFRAH